MRAAQRARELVRERYGRQKPVMGASDDTGLGHSFVLATAKLGALSTVVHKWDEQYLELLDREPALEIKLEAITAILSMTEVDL